MYLFPFHFSGLIRIHLQTTQKNENASYNSKNTEICFVFLFSLLWLVIVGHSWVIGGLWAEIGFDMFAISRINYEYLLERESSQNIEFIWKGSNSLGEDGYIFVHLLNNTYSTPAEIQFTSGKNTVYLQNDATLPTFSTNFVQLAQSFITDVRERSKWYRHNNIIIPYGSDFAHQNSFQTMLQMDKLMDYINSNQTYNVTIFYSSLEEYIIAVNKLNLTWPLETQDFFAYESAAHQYWTGYYTSRPFLKAYVRSRERDLRIAEQFYVFAMGLFGSNGMKYTSNNDNGLFVFNSTAAMFNITKLRRAIDVTQHHDAITGTETQAVSNDYIYMLGNGTERCNNFVQSVTGMFLKKGDSFPTNLVRNGEYLMSLIDGTNRVVWVVYNSLAWYC